ncbi:SEC-C metal-binding domain-containing protein [Dethiothermospora halolimnae]|uniref:SEC-C metal-binding domain-containing protein n=1 Tax=Dethiothermospora halolimnae TaxID=3114390 RepID=UPI003CCBB459
MNIMSLFEQWKETAYIEDAEEYNKFWGEYLPKEQSVYEYLLEHKDETVEGTLSNLAEKFEMDKVIFTGFLDGVNTSLTEEVDMDNLTEESNIKLSLDFEKLYYNMLEAKADWLYKLPQWDNVLTKEKRKDIKKEYNKAHTVVKGKKIGRNEPCPCGSGKKYKKCCLNK